MKSNRSAIGARVYCRTEGYSQMQEVRSGGSYISQSDFRLHFGLAAAKQCSLEIRWPTGKVEKIPDPPVNQIVTIVEGKGIKA
ncbi:MAG: ASPIC/UnbV domain-containing protein [Bryobacteraceae bacterium]